MTRLAHPLVRVPVAPSVLTNLTIGSQGRLTHGARFLRARHG